MKNQNEERVSIEIVSIAYSNFMQMFHPSKTGGGFFFWNFIGGVGALNYVWHFPPEQAKRIRLLAGPNYKTIAKAMVILGCDPYTELQR